MYSNSAHYYTPEKTALAFRTKALIKVFRSNDDKLFNKYNNCP